MKLERVKAAAAEHQLRVVGVAGDTVLLGPTPIGFWDMFIQSAEYNDGLEDPIDRWSHRVISQLADVLDAKPVFPFGPNPGNFLQLSKDSGVAWQSPVGMLVHASAGMWISYRGALVFPSPLDDDANVSETPCRPCPKPCTTACPIGALTTDGYDVPACQTYIQTDAGADCLNNGCRVRRACPISQDFGRNPAQSKFHMLAFLP